MQWRRLRNSNQNQERNRIMNRQTRIRVWEAVRNTSKRPWLSSKSMNCSHFHSFIHLFFWRLLIPSGSVVKNLPANARDLGSIHGLGRSPGEGNGNTLQYSCLENPMDGGAWWAAVHGVATSDTPERLHFHFSLSCIGEGNGNPLQCSCLENPRDGGPWWAAIYRIAQRRTWLKWLSSKAKETNKKKR